MYILVHIPSVKYFEMLQNTYINNNNNNFDQIQFTNRVYTDTYGWSYVHVQYIHNLPHITMLSSQSSQYIYVLSIPSMHNTGRFFFKKKNPPPLPESYLFLILYLYLIEILLNYFYISFKCGINIQLVRR